VTADADADADDDPLPSSPPRGIPMLTRQVSAPDDVSNRLIERTTPTSDLDEIHIQLRALASGRRAETPRRGYGSPSKDPWTK